MSRYSSNDRKGQENACIILPISEEKRRRFQIAGMNARRILLQTFIFSIGFGLMLCLHRVSAYKRWLGEPRHFERAGASSAVFDNQPRYAVPVAKSLRSHKMLGEIGGLTARRKDEQR